MARSCALSYPITSRSKNSRVITKYSKDHSVQLSYGKPELAFHGQEVLLAFTFLTTATPHFSDFGPISLPSAPSPPLETCDMPFPQPQVPRSCLLSVLHRPGILILSLNVRHCSRGAYPFVVQYHGPCSLASQLAGQCVMMLLCTGSGAVHHHKLPGGGVILHFPISQNSALMYMQ